MAYKEDDFLQLSGLQHFAFCRRQWALIHIENQWQENLRTVEGDLFHERAHDEQQRERRGDTLILRGLSVFSASLGLSGKCDVTEFHRDPRGVSLQAMCLEEMLCCSVSEGALFYGETRRRFPVEFTPELRKQVRDFAEEMHQYFQRGYTPKGKPGKHCNACSLKELCLPRLTKKSPVKDYLHKAMEEAL